MRNDTQAAAATAAKTAPENFADVKFPATLDQGSHNAYAFDVPEGQAMSIERVGAAKGGTDGDITVLVNGRPRTLEVGHVYEGITGHGTLELNSVSGGEFNLKTKTAKVAGEAETKAAKAS